MKSKISVVIPNFNDPRIARTLEMFSKQNYSNLEVTVVEGCKENDLTIDIYKSYESLITNLIHEKDNGIFDALNKGIKACTGDYIMLMGSDDRLSHFDVFEKVSSLLDANVSGVCLDCHFVNDEDGVVRSWRPRSVTKAKIRLGILPPHFSLILHRDVYERIGLFELQKEKLGIDSRWLLNLISVPELNIVTLPGRSTLMQLGGVSTVSVKNILKGNLNMMREARKLGVLFWPLIPIIKMFSKVFQLNLKIKPVSEVLGS